MICALQRVCEHKTNMKSDVAVALKENNLERSHKMVINDMKINRRRFEIEISAMVREIYSMADKAVDMLHRAMTTFADEDLQMSLGIIREDDIIDECYTRLYYGVVNHVLGDPRNIERANYVIWIAHNLERLGTGPQMFASVSST